MSNGALSQTLEYCVLAYIRLCLIYSSSQLNNVQATHSIFFVNTNDSTFCSCLVFITTRKWTEEVRGGTFHRKIFKSTCTIPPESFRWISSWTCVHELITCTLSHLDSHTTWRGSPPGLMSYNVNMRCHIQDIHIQEIRARFCHWPTCVSAKYNRIVCAECQPGTVAVGPYNHRRSAQQRWYWLVLGTARGNSIHAKSTIWAGSRITLNI